MAPHDDHSAGADASARGRAGRTLVPERRLRGLAATEGLEPARGRPTPWPREAWLLPIAVVGVALCTPILSSMSRYAMSAWPVFVLALCFARYWAHGDFIA